MLLGSRLRSLPRSDRLDRLERGQLRDAAGGRRQGGISSTALWLHRPTPHGQEGTDLPAGLRFDQLAGVDRRLGLRDERHGRVDEDERRHTSRHVKASLALTSAKDSAAVRPN